MSCYAYCSYTIHVFVYCCSFYAIDMNVWVHCSTSCLIKITILLIYFTEHFWLRISMPFAWWWNCWHLFSSYTGYTNSTLRAEVPFRLSIFTESFAFTFAEQASFCFGFYLCCSCSSKETSARTRHFSVKHASSCHPQIRTNYKNSKGKSQLTKSRSAKVKAKDSVRIERRKGTSAWTQGTIIPCLSYNFNESLVL